jgi:hypothetical protein
MKTKVLVFKTGRELQDFLKEVQYMPSMFNRKVKDTHVRSMLGSIKEIGVQRVFNIIETKSFSGKKTLYFADGQHLAKGVLSIPEGDLKGGFVAFVNQVDEVDNIIPFVSLMNSTAKNWILNDYLNAWITHGLEDYAYIRNMHLKTEYGLSGLIEAFSNKVNKGNRDFKNGVFVAHKENGQKLIALHKKAVSMGLRNCNSSFLAVVRFFTINPEIDEEKFLKGISKDKHFGAKFNRDSFISLFRTIKY